ncbi:MAG: 3-deoxy-7-phosphoheptulonate synthase [Clostridia bacterium]|nr:3-deoxy-7-phosphoheptulonate synthase [Clostridia bacterium]MBQ5808145.1 3-deoxy-7-phosphoheptulonate synthase [Clostridia bacterium]
MSMIYEKKLPTPVEVKEQYPITFAAEQTKAKLDAEIAKVFRGESDKKLLIIGPCSADREDAVMEYCTRLKRVQEKVSDKLILIPRIYTNKPRTTGDGYKGMLYQPDPNQDPDPFHGILAIRALHTRVLTELGLCTADEMLYPTNYGYLSDLLSYVAVGARSVENQEHRLVSSGIDVPVGMKNPTGGDLSVMMNAIVAATHAHTFIYREWAVSTKGNPLAHAILRGYVDKNGKSLPNYHYEDLKTLCELYAKSEIKNPALIVDTNHSNSGKKYQEQPRICKDVLHSCRHDADVAKLVKGFMIESYIEEGNQKIAADDVFGKSITDPCLGWDASEKLIMELAEIL